MLTLSMKKNLEKNLTNCPAGSEIDYYGMPHLRLVYDGTIIGVISLDSCSLEEIKDYLEAQGFKLGQKVDPSSVRAIPNGLFGWK